MKTETRGQNREMIFRMDRIRKRKDEKIKLNSRRFVDLAEALKIMILYNMFV